MAKVLFRADPGFRLRRCLSLAAAMKESAPGTEAVFLSACPPAEAALISGAGFRFERMEAFGAWDGEATAEKAAELSADAIVADVAHADEAYLSQLRPKAKLAVFDHAAALKSYDADAVVNPAMHSHLLAYPQDCGAELFLGTDFAPLPQALDAFADQPRTCAEKARKLLLCFGADQGGLSVAAARALKALPDHFSAVIATCPGFSKGGELAAEVGLDPRFNVICDPEPSKRFGSADIAIADPSFIPEVLFFALPSILAASTEDAEAQYAARCGMARSVQAGSRDTRALGEAAAALLGSVDERRRMSARMADLVDGLGRYRLATELLRVFGIKGESL